MWFCSKSKFCFSNVCACAIILLQCCYVLLKMVVVAGLMKLIQYYYKRTECFYDHDSNLWQFFRTNRHLWYIVAVRHMWNENETKQNGLYSFQFQSSILDINLREPTWVILVVLTCDPRILVVGGSWFLVIFHSIYKFTNTLNCIGLYLLFFESKLGTKWCF
jgi:hypothetical protein